MYRSILNPQTNIYNNGGWVFAPMCFHSTEFENLPPTTFLSRIRFSTLVANQYASRRVNRNRLSHGWHLGEERDGIPTWPELVRWVTRRSRNTTGRWIGPKVYLRRKKDQVPYWIIIASSWNSLNCWIRSQLQTTTVIIPGSTGNFIHR